MLGRTVTPVNAADWATGGASLQHGVRSGMCCKRRYVSRPRMLRKCCNSNQHLFVESCGMFIIFPSRAIEILISPNITHAFHCTQYGKICCHDSEWMKQLMNSSGYFSHHVKLYAVELHIHLIKKQSSRNPYGFRILSRKPGKTQEV